MPETFLILLAGGVMFAAAVSDPRAVTLLWLRLAGIISLTLMALASFFFARRESRTIVALIPLMLATLAVFAQLAFVQVAWRRTQRVLAAIGYVGAGVSGAAMLITLLDPRSFANSHALLAAGCALASAVAGLALMDMLLGHAYLNAAPMTMRPFLRLNRALAIALIARAGLSIASAVLIQWVRPIPMFWAVYGLYLGTRWAVGLLVPGIFVWMAHDCIRRRATQSATGILYVAGVLLFIGEMIGLWLMSQTGWPL